MLSKRESWIGSIQKLAIRMPEGLLGLLNDMAKQNHRSLNSEIVRRIVLGLDHPDQDPVRVLERTELQPGDEKMLAAFRLLEPSKQRALLSVMLEMTTTSEKA